MTESPVPRGDDAGCLLSVVATSRNDDHGGSLLLRMQLFVDGWVAQCKRHHLRAELILVDWNPPGDRPSLREALRWPEDPEPCAIRIITVPGPVHRRFKHSDTLSLFQMIAKNVGLRRASGRYLLATNIDIIFPDDTIRYLRDRLEPDRVYRTDRCDVPMNVPAGLSFDGMLQFCRREMFRVNARGRTLVRAGDRWESQSHVFHRLLPQLVRRWKARAAESLALIRLFVGTRLYRPGRRAASGMWVRARRAFPRLVAGGRRWPGFGACFRGAAGALLGSARSLGEAVRRAARAGRGTASEAGRLLRTLFRGCLQEGRFLMRLFTRTWRVRARPFTNACGDFTLMAREDWFRLRGYPEWEMFSWHLDSVLLYQAHCSGVREVYLGRSPVIYHIEHSPASGYTPEGADALFRRLEAKGIPYLSMEDFERIVQGMARRRRERRGVVYNKEHWGLADVTFHEEVIGGA